MNHDYDIDWLIERRPELSAPSRVTTDRARASLLAHGARHRRRRRRALAVAGALAAAGAAVALLNGHAGPVAGGRSHVTLAIAPAATGTRTRTRTGTAVTAKTPLVRLAADVRVQPSAPQPGDATLVVRDTVLDGAHEVDGAVYGGYDLYTDSGRYYYAPDSLAQLQQQVDSHQTVIDSGNEAKALDTIAAAAGGTPEQARIATLSTFPHGLDPMPTPAQVKASIRRLERLTKRRFPYVAPTLASWRLSQDSDLWIAATQALAVGAGRSDVRAGAMKALSTLTSVIETPTQANGTAALKVDFPDGGTPEIIWLNATTGVPIQEQDGSNSATTFEVERVSAARLPSQISPDARLR
jgi:hypothetical protein